MFSGLDKYRMNGRNIASRETASASPAGYVKGRKETARSKETASASTSVSGMALGGVTHDDISLNYIGGTSNQRSGGAGSSGVPQEVYKYYDALYREDSICGAAIELRANIPYGDFRLHGVGKAELQVYEEAVDNMRLRTMMPRVAIERDVQGSFFGMLDWNGGNNTYDSLLPYSRQHIKSIIYPLVHGMDPVIDIEANAFLTDIANNPDPRLADIKKCIPNFILQGVSGGGGKGIPVPMDSVVWIDRPHTDPRFNSMLHRILPLFLIERALTRGTIEASHRRQRGILHITAGNGDMWLATPEEMGMVAELFNNADADPLGAIVVTREGISPNEVRNPTDFWRITDSYEQTVPFKMRALGISESFLSGDATFNNAEVAISTFLQTLKAERSQVTDQLMRRKIFAQIAKARGFRIGGRERGSQMDLFAEYAGMSAMEIAANSANALDNIAMLKIPDVAWKQSLMPEGDQAYIDILMGLADRNVPPPIRALFAAGGLDFDQVMDNTKADLADRKRLTEYLDSIKEVSPAPEPEPGMGDEFAMFGGTREVGILNRSYDDAEKYEPYSEMGDGRKTWATTTTGKQHMREKQVKEHAKALARHAERHNAKIRTHGEFES